MKSYIEQSKRKKILLIGDDIRAHSGVGSVSRDLVMSTSHHYNWINMGGAIQHPEFGKRIDISKDVNDHTGISDAYTIIYPVHGYGDQDIIRQVMKIEKPDAIMLFTDPRYFYHVFMMENEIRKNIPLLYLNIWDCTPYPRYNKEFYASCDLLLSISKQTKNINEVVLGKENCIDLDN